MAKAEVQIRGRQYSIACAPGREDRLVNLSRQLDERVEIIARAVGDVGDDRLLLVAALSLLDELDAASRGVAVAAAPELGRAATALSDAARRIEALAERIEDHT
ncbi:MAG: cell division protein ZapA [Pseudomonadota bacterium]